MGKERPLEELDGFWGDRELKRTLHIGWEDEETLYFDLFDSAIAGSSAEDNRCLVAILLNLRTATVRIEGGER